MTYNPWGFSTGTNPAAASIGNSTAYCNVQQNGASGYLTFYFNVYNPTTANASANITVYLYDHLPEGGPSSTPINQFTFSSGTLAAGAQAWVTVNTNIFWAYNSLVVIPQQITGTIGTGIGVAIPSAYNQVDSHFWNNYWNESDAGFTAFWSITNTAPASLPIAVTNPVRVSEGNAASVASSSASLNFTLATVPNGKKWKLLVAYVSGIAGSSITLSMNIQRNGITLSDEYIVSYATKTATSGDLYVAYGSISGASPTGLNIFSALWQEYPILYAGDFILVYNNSSSSNYTAVYYVESDI